MILFRQLRRAVMPPAREPGEYWYVEYHGDPGVSRFPWGIAFVSVTGDAPPRLDFILVADPCRGRGFATALLAACVERWHDIDLGQAKSGPGSRLLRKFRSSLPPPVCARCGATGHPPASSCPACAKSGGRAVSAQRSDKRHGCQGS